MEKRQRTCDILIVDDDAKCREYMRESIETAASGTVRIGEAESGERAMAHLSSQHADILILDYAMPGLTGSDVLTALSNGGAKPFVVGFTAHEDHVVDLENGCALIAFTKGRTRECIRFVVKLASTLCSRGQR